MKKLYSTVVAVFAFVVSAPVATPAGPSFPSWSQQLPGNKRFEVLKEFNNVTVLDQETGLVWERSPGDMDGNGVVNSSDRKSWSDAQVTCNYKNVAGRLGWRLPTIEELASLLDPNVPFPGPALPLNHPFLNVQSFFGSAYWSATTHASATGWGLVVGFGYLFSTEINDFKPVLVVSDYKITLHFVWCVRGGQGFYTQ
jgi:hypothetical protein